MKNKRELVTLSDYSEALKTYMNFLYMVDKHKDTTDGVKFQAQRHGHVFMVECDFESIE